MSSVLLFGASGFIGGHVRSALAGDRRIGTVTCAGRDRYDLAGGDLDALIGLLREVRPDAVVNCTGALAGNARDLVLANTAVTAKLIEAIAAVAPGARLVRLGSAAEYGVVPHGMAVAEDWPCEPVSEYGVTHLAGTSLVRLASADGRVDGVVLRVFNPIGHGLHADNMLGRAAGLIRQAQADGGREVTLASLGAYRDFVDVRDVAAAVLAAVVAPALPARVFNIASGRAVPAREAVRLLAEAAGYTGEIHERGQGPARSAAVTWMRGDISQARRVLGWIPAHELADAVKGVWTTR
jgi:nucleoside-diphosphate-sugar epimerase